MARGSWRGKEPPEIRGSGYVVAGLAAAIWAVAGADDVRDAVLRAANLGDDADTTAAIAGQLAGARWGASGIPSRWRELLTDRDRIEAIAGRLHDAATAATPEGPWPHDGFVHAYWVEPGRILAGEYPGHPSPRRARAKVDLLVDHGIRTFVDLTSPIDGLDAYDGHVTAAAEARSLDLVRVHHPIPDMGVLGDADYDPIVTTIRDAAERGGVYVHCWGGMGRTGTVVGCLLVDGGRSGDEALARLVDLRAGTRKARVTVPQTETQQAVVRRRGDRRA